MQELNTTAQVIMVCEDQFDAMTITDLSEALSISQVTEDGEPQTVILGPVQRRSLLIYLEQSRGN